MSAKSKITITTMLAIVALLIAYAFFAVGAVEELPDEPAALQWWARAILVFIGIGIATLIVVHVLSRVALAIAIAVKERDENGDRVERILASSLKDDEMDHVVAARAARVAAAFIGIGFVAMLALLALGGSAVVGIHILFGSFAAGSLSAGVFTVIGYERGVRND